MILDERLEFCDATALNTGGAATYTIGDQIDLIGLGTGITIVGNSTNEFPGHGAEPLYLVLQVDTTATSGGSATAQFKLVSDSVATLDSSATVHWASEAIAVASLTAGTVLAVVPLPAATYERYLGITQTTAVAAFTAGKINAFLTDKPETWRAMADNIS